MSPHNDNRAYAKASTLSPRLLSAMILASLMPGGAMAAAAAAALPAAPAASSYDFDTSFLSTGSSQVDFSRFSQGNVVLPGTYRADIVVNDHWLGREDVTFKAVDGQASAVPCLGSADLTRWGVNLDKVARGDGTRNEQQVKAHAITASELCGDISKTIPGATLSFDAGKQALTLSVPQLFMNNSARGYVDPSQWDNGINAGILGYNFSSSRTTGPYSSTQSYLGVNAGVNLGAWRLRHQGSLTWSSNRNGKQYQNIATYVQRDIPSLHAQLKVGDTFTSGQVADSFRVRGVSLATDPRMYPQSQQGYAPVVRGIAESNARVTIRQNGYIIYETTVAPGPFEINDLFPTGYGGDLEVTVTEADGRNNIFLVPYTAIPNLLRPGMSQFSVTAGELQQYGTGSKPWAAQGSWQYGFNNTLTGFASTTASQGYAQLRGGVAINTRYGALGVDVATSHTTINGADNLQGQSVGVTFAKNWTESGTNLSLGAYRFSSSGYLGVLDAVNVRELNRRSDDFSAYARQRSNLNLNINQKIGNGQLFINGSTTDYWGGSGRTTSYSAGYNSSFKSVNWGLSVQRIRTQPATYKTPAQLDAEAAEDIFFGPGHTTLPGITDNRIMLTLSVPLGTSPKAPSLYSSLSRDTGSSPNKGIQLGVNGVAGNDNNVTYGVSANRTIGQGDSKYFNANVGYQGSYANVRGGYSRSNGMNQLSASTDGGVIVHGGGVSFSQRLGDTVGLIEARDATGAKVGNGNGIRVDGRGYAVVPYLTPYQLNTVNLDPEGTGTDVELKETTQKVAPHLGSVVKLKFETESGRAVVIRAKQANGEPLPFGADVRDAQGNSVGVVGQAGKIFARGVADQGTLTVNWGDDADSQCRIAYTLPPLAKGTRQQVADMVQGTCVSSHSSSKPSASFETQPLQPEIHGTEAQPNAEHRNDGVSLSKHNANGTTTTITPTALRKPSPSTQINPLFEPSLLLAPGVSHVSV
jgi:outer membrane usher protein